MARKQEMREQQGVKQRGERGGTLPSFVLFASDNCFINITGLNLLTMTEQMMTTPKPKKNLVNGSDLLS
jgi:hypothetical protein